MERLLSHNLQHTRKWMCCAVKLVGRRIGMTMYAEICACFPPPPTAFRWGNSSFSLCPSFRKSRRPSASHTTLPACLRPRRSKRSRPIFNAFKSSAFQGYDITGKPGVRILHDWPPDYIGGYFAALVPGLLVRSCYPSQFFTVTCECTSRHNCLAAPRICNSRRPATPSLDI